MILHSQDYHNEVQMHVPRQSRQVALQAALGHTIPHEWERHFSLPKAPQPHHEEKVRRVLELLTLDLKVLGLGRQGHEVTGGVDGGTEALQPSLLGSGREV